MERRTDGWKNRPSSRGTEGQMDESDLMGCCPTNVDCPIETFFKTANKIRHI